MRILLSKFPIYIFRERTTHRVGESVDRFSCVGYVLVFFSGTEQQVLHLYVIRTNPAST